MQHRQTIDEDMIGQFLYLAAMLIFIAVFLHGAPSRCVHKPVHATGRGCAFGCTALRVLDAGGSRDI